jgi:hypothetical protein
MPALTDEEREFVQRVRDDRSKPSDDKMSARDIAVFIALARRLKVLASDLDVECAEIERGVTDVLRSRV